MNKRVTIQELADFLGVTASEVKGFISLHIWENTSTIEIEQFNLDAYNRRVYDLKGIPTKNTTRVALVN